jgi:hypothetical protein
LGGDATADATASADGNANGGGEEASDGGGGGAGNHSGEGGLVDNGYMEGGGCSCSVPHATSAGAAGWCLLALGIGLRLGRRRRR